MSSSPSPLIDMANEIHEKFKKFMGMLPGSSEPPKSDHDKAVEEVNANLNAHANDAANASFAAAAEKMKGQSNSYDFTKKQPLKSYSK